MGREGFRMRKGIGVERREGRGGYGVSIAGSERGDW